MENNQSFEYTYSAACGALVVRCFDMGRYFFLFPFAELWCPLILFEDFISFVSW